MIEFTAIETLIMAYSPLVVAIIGIVCAFCKMIKNIKQIIKGIIHEIKLFLHRF